MGKGSSETVLGRNVRVRGRITGEGDLVVQGTLEGDVSLRGDFTLDQGAEATSTVAAHRVTVAGSLEGAVHAEGEVVVAAGGRLRGDVRAAQVTLEDGAYFAGRLDAEFDLPPELAAPRREEPKRR